MLNVVFSSILMLLTANRGAAGAEKHASDAVEEAADLISDQPINIISSPRLQRPVPSVLVVVVAIVVVNVTTNETEK